MSNRSFVAALAVVILPLMTACSPTIRKPQLAHPGPAPVQRYNAQVFDPYPLPDMGPEIVGGRPPDYLTPVPEVQRARDYVDSRTPAVTPVLAPQTPIYAAPGPVYAPLPTIPPVEYRY